MRAVQGEPRRSDRHGPENGRLLVLANWPTFNPQNLDDSTPEVRRNRCLTDPYEPGSTFKPFIAGPATPILSPGTSRDARVRCDRGPGAGCGGRCRRPAGRHDLAHVRPSGARRRHRRTRPDRSRGAVTVARTSGRTASMKIASLLPSATEIVYALGLGDSLIGVTDECDYPPAAVTKPVISRSALSQGHLQTPREIDDAVRAKVGAERAALPAGRRPAPPRTARRDPHAGPVPRLRGAERAGAAGARPDRSARTRTSLARSATPSTRSSRTIGVGRDSCSTARRRRTSSMAALRQRVAAVKETGQASADGRRLRVGVVRPAVRGRPLDARA